MGRWTLDTSIPNQRGNPMVERHATAAVVSGVLVCGIPPLALMFARPSAHWLSYIAILSPLSLTIVMLADSFLFVSHGRTGRIAHLSGCHVVGEPCCFGVRDDS